METAKEPEYFLAAMVENNKLMKWLKNPSRLSLLLSFKLFAGTRSSFRQMHLGWLRYNQHVAAVFTKNLSADENKIQEGL